MTRAEIAGLLAILVAAAVAVAIVAVRFLQSIWPAVVS